jgi:cytochrome c1
LISSFTRVLKAQFARGECDVILTTEDTVDPGAETLAELPLVWVGAPGGAAWKSRPLKLAYEHNCIFRQGVQAALDAAGVPWVMAVESDSTRTIEASVSADLAVHTVLAGSEPPYVERVQHGGSLPELARMKVNLYVADPVHSKTVEALAAMIRRTYAARAKAVAA